MSRCSIINSMLAHVRIGYASDVVIP